MEWLEIAATSVESAKEQALVHLGVDESDAEFEVLSEARTGLFGRVKQEARVRARVLPEPVRPKESRGRSHSRKTGSSKRSSPSRSDRAKPVHNERAGFDEPPRGSRRPSGTEGSTPVRDSAEKAPKIQNKEDGETMTEFQDSGPSLLEQADLAESFVRGIGEALDISVMFERHDIENGILRIEASGDGIGILIGHHGATAQAIDDLVRTMLQRSGGTTREGKIRMDVGGVRARRASALAEFARSLAKEALEASEEVVLEPMNRMDRKIVHDALAGINSVESRSEGEDPYRRVIISAVSD